MTNGQYAIDDFNGSESWRLFRILSEVVDGFDLLKDIPPSISIFGSARTPEDNPMYEETTRLAEILGRKGYGIITGGGGGIMEAGNLGAMKADVPSIGLAIKLPQEQKTNVFVSIESNYRYFFIRKLMFLKYSSAFIAMPGGMGTVDEISEAFVAIQTQKNRPVPLILYKRSFWEGLLDWIKDTMIAQGNLSKEELNIIQVCDTPEEVLSIIENFKP